MMKLPQIVYFLLILAPTATGDIGVFSFNISLTESGPEFNKFISKLRMKSPAMNLVTFDNLEFRFAAFHYTDDSKLRIPDLVDELSHSLNVFAPFFLRLGNEYIDGHVVKNRVSYLGIAPELNKRMRDHFHDAFIRHGIYPIRHDSLADANDIILARLSPSTHSDAYKLEINALTYVKFMKGEFLFVLPHSMSLTARNTGQKWIAKSWP
ncbi:hypothetical protein PRIPAC_86023 [Pristionchus pacificus]|uniref:Uncharacterized protein n=1 Tax=Pristionchus pacificus TaxID=54126 RepID=A0A2A6BUG9_PRIPA|nr:hypothetical protein PRIPAC_86023 [Pristionchus pacificus]|eukprot:PDM69518.1 hypothetical protein PRIPAC_44614 [Pristionchus pacificus]